MILDGHHHIEKDWQAILARMDALGIDKTVLVGVGVRDLGVVTIKDSIVFRSKFLFKHLGSWKARRLVNSRALREALLGEPNNDRVLEAIKAEPDRFMGFVFVNPESPRALEEITRCLDAGMCGIKLALVQYPTDLAGPRMAAICEIARARRVPIFFHQGVTTASADPRKMFNDFRDVTFIVAHTGVQYFDEMIPLAKAFDNVFVDTSSFISTRAKIAHLCKALGPHKLVFGTDVPVMCGDPVEALRKITTLPASDADKEAILGGNLRGILRVG
ncbi:MAG: amidohydrolase family protein [Kiritimatiellae bacterium]|nr:amidohydrolase family protein [Kiritimatiellia bacterium]